VTRPRIATERERLEVVEAPNHGPTLRSAALEAAGASHRSDLRTVKFNASPIATLRITTDGRSCRPTRYCIWPGWTPPCTSKESFELLHVLLGPEEEPRRVMQARPRRTKAAQDMAEGGFGKAEASADVAGRDESVHGAPPKRRRAGESIWIQRYSAIFSDFQ